jgi:hypothetical protein
MSVMLRMVGGLAVGLAFHTAVDWLGVEKGCLEILSVPSAVIMLWDETTEESGEKRDLGILMGRRNLDGMRHTGSR